jgi:hypothetical protein
MEPITVKIIGKGMTAVKFLDEPLHPSDIVVAINQSANILPHIDYLFANDIEGMEGISDQILQSIKNIAVPEYPHINGWSNKNVTFETIKEKLSPSNNLIIYNLWTSPKKNNSYVHLDKTISTADTAISYFAKIKKVKYFKLYGIGISNGYHPSILSNLPENLKKFSNGWSSARHIKLRENIDKLKDMYMLDISLN